MVPKQQSLNQTINEDNQSVKEEGRDVPSVKFYHGECESVVVFFSFFFYKIYSDSHGYSCQSFQLSILVPEMRGYVSYHFIRDGNFDDIVERSHVKVNKQSLGSRRVNDFPSSSTIRVLRGVFYQTGPCLFYKIKTRDLSSTYQKFILHLTSRNRFQPR